MKKTYSRREFVSTSLKGLVGISLLGLVNCSKKKFWETREYNETLKKIYQLADEIYPKNFFSENQFSIVAIEMRYFDSHEHNSHMINENGSVTDIANYHPSLHALNETLSYYKVRMAQIKRGEKPPFVRDFFYKH